MKIEEKIQELEAKPKLKHKTEFKTTFDRGPKPEILVQLNNQIFSSETHIEVLDRSKL